MEASIEDLSFKTAEESLEVDAAPPISPHLELKLAQEYNYHKYGSRIVDQPDLASHSVYNPLPQQPANSRWPGDVSSQMSSVKPTTYPTPQDNQYLRPAASSSLDGSHRQDLASQLSMPYSEVDRLNHPTYNRFKSCPDSGSAAESLILDSNPGQRLNSQFICPPSDSGTVNSEQ